MKFTKFNKKQGDKKEKDKKQLSRKQLRKEKKLEKKKKKQNYQLIKQERSFKKAIKHVNEHKKNNKNRKTTKEQGTMEQHNKEKKQKQKLEMFEDEQNMEDIEVDDEDNQQMDEIMEQFDRIGRQGQQEYMMDEDYDGDDVDYDGEDEEMEEYDEVHSDDERIEMYEQKLNIKGSKSKKYDKIAQSLGFESDLFSFLDGISSKVKQAKKQTKIKTKKEKNTKKQKNIPSKIDVQKNVRSQIPNQRDIPAKSGPPKFIKPQNAEIRKMMNALFNKISDGNLLYTVRSFVDIFENNPKSITIQTFANLFIRFNLLIQKPLVHVLSANVVVAVALHRIYGDRLMAQIIFQLTKQYGNLELQVEDVEQIEQIGYSKLFEKKKNYYTILCFLYEFGSVSAQFFQSLVAKLTNEIQKQENIEFIYIIIQKCGVKMRANDTGALKQIIQILKEGIEKAKADGTYETTKIKFIDIEINQIKFNRKNLFDADQRMGFLHTFLSKTVAAELPLEKKTLDVTYDIVKNANPNDHQWWLGEAQQRVQGDQQEQITIKIETQQMKNLRQLAKAYHFVTEVRKNIFFQLMSSADYIEATKKILELKVKRLQEVATVLLQVNGNEPQTFNPFYSLVAARIAQEIPKFRVNLQFALWDRFKQLDSYDARKMSNLGKFAAWLISNENSNSSLSIFKFFPDLNNLKSREIVFMKVFFKQFLRKVKKNYLIKLSDKLKDKRNKNVRDGLKQLLGDLKQDFEGESQKIKDNCKILKKLLIIQETNQMENED